MLGTCSLLIVLAMAGSPSSAAQPAGTPVDSFEAKGLSVRVRFFDPMESLTREHPDFAVGSSGTPSERKSLELWIDHLHHAALYLFTVLDKDGRVLKHYCVRGNPEVRDSAAYYMVETISSDVPQPFDPSTQKYAKFTERTDRLPAIRGELFDHMKMFQPHGVAAAGDGVKLMGAYVRVVTYAEVKKSVVEIMTADPK